MLPMLATGGGDGVVSNDGASVAASALTVTMLMRKGKYPHRMILHRKFAPRRFPP